MAGYELTACVQRQWKLFEKEFLVEDSQGYKTSAGQVNPVALFLCMCGSCSRYDDKICVFLPHCYQKPQGQKELGEETYHYSAIEMYSARS